MSVASEFPPEVYIPDRARRGQPQVRHLAIVPALSSQLSPVVRLRSAAPSRLCVEELIGEPAPLRLTRRGVAVLVVSTIIAGALLLLIAHASRGQAPTGNQASSMFAGSVTVQNGDTLWSIAQRVEPAADPRKVVDQLRRLNHLTSVELSPGQTLKLG